MCWGFVLQFFFFWFSCNELARTSLSYYILHCTLAGRDKGKGKRETKGNKKKEESDAIQEAEGKKRKARRSRRFAVASSRRTMNNFVNRCLSINHIFLVYFEIVALLKASKLGVPLGRSDKTPLVASFRISPLIWFGVKRLFPSGFLGVGANFWM